MLDLVPLQPAEPFAISAPDKGLESARNLVNLWLADSKTDATRHTYSDCLGDFASFMRAESAEHAIARVLTASKAQATALIEAYRADLLESRKLSPASVNLRIAAIRSLLAKAFDLDLIPWMVRIRKLKNETLKDTRGPGVEAVNDMFAIASKRLDAKGARDRAILRLLWDLALRRAEIISLDLEHVDFDRGVVWVKGKGRRERGWITLPDETRDALKEWIDHRGREPGPLFIGLSNNQGGQRLAGNSLHWVVSQLGKKIGKKTFPHGWRHASVTAALDATNGNVRDVRLHSRHADISMVTRYDDQRQDKAGSVARLVAGQLRRRQG